MTKSYEDRLTAVEAALAQAEPMIKYLSDLNQVREQEVRNLAQALFTANTLLREERRKTWEAWDWLHSMYSAQHKMLRALRNSHAALKELRAKTSVSRP